MHIADLADLVVGNHGITVTADLWARLALMVRTPSYSYSLGCLLTLVSMYFVSLL